jgi:hypothetical protein
MSDWKIDGVKIILRRGSTNVEILLDEYRIRWSTRGSMFRDGGIANDAKKLKSWLEERGFDIVFGAADLDGEGEDEESNIFYWIARIKNIRSLPEALNRTRLARSNGSEIRIGSAGKVITRPLQREKPKACSLLSKLVEFKPERCERLSRVKFSILELIGEGRSKYEIALILMISFWTVKRHVKELREKSLVRVILKDNRSHLRLTSKGMMSLRGLTK